ncbi:hypothetical protein D3C87_1674330 [compost metagenome]
MTGGEVRPSGDHPGECHAISNSRLLACRHGVGLRVQRTGLQWAAPGGEGALAWQGKEEGRPCRGAKFIGSVAPITLISHRFECQTRRFFAILRGGPRSVSDGRHRVGGMDEAVTTPLCEVGPVRY